MKGMQKIMPTPRSFNDVSREVVKSFLQSVVLIDDRAYFGEEPIPLSALQIVAPGPGDAQPADAKVEKIAEAEFRSHKLNAKLMIEVFAARGLVCGVLKPVAPQTFEDLMKQTLPAVRRADIVIIDWQLEGVIGDALETIRRIIDADDKDCAGLRLIAVYTGVTGLFAIAERLKNGLAEFEYVDKDANTLSLTNGRVRIAVFGKEGTKVLSSEADRVLTIEQLPDALIAEYAETTKGLVPNVALASLAALRNYTHFLLSKMNSGLDASYLTHRVLLEYPDDAVPLLAELVSSELQSIIEQANVEEQADLEHIERWLEHYSLDYAANFHPVKSDDWPTLIRELLIKGHTNDDVKKRFSGLGQKKRSAVQFQKSNEGDKSEREFAMLTTLKTRYTTPSPILTLGQILHISNEGSDTFWLCMQPVCDSVRIEGQRAFPLLPMEINPSSDNDKGNVFVVKYSVDKYAHLKPRYKPHNCQMVVFTADAQTQKVVAVEQGDGTFCFISDQNVCYHWIAQLKPGSAQHVANEYASAVGRVGRDISEWLRTYPK